MSIPALKKIYQEKVVPELKKTLGIDNPHMVPNLEKIVVSSGIRSEMPKEWVQEVVKEIAKNIKSSGFDGIIPSSPRPARASPTSSCAKASPTASR